MRIALVTDTHLSPHDDLLARNWAAIADWIGQTAPDLLIHLGDISANGVHDPDELRRAREQIGALACDQLYLPGNHDIGDAQLARGHDERLNQASLLAYREAFGADWWSVHLEGWQLLGLNAQLLGSGGEDEARQWAWLAQTAASSDAPLGIMTHKPLRRFGPDRPGRYPSGDALERLSSLLADRDLRFVISGHTHQALRISEGRTEHIWVPSAAFVFPDSVQAPVGEKPVGAMTLELLPDRYEVRLVAPDGLHRRSVLELEHLYPQVAALRPATLSE